ncbi:alanine racemase [Agrococcus sp. SGAir0287]|uniref:alanine racemase n=1 Tax=Agrococcus sp. SGAir0287 TaxID=2070347 RepID=UPI0010CD662C|nr:alanine racemase [Agrococcus sp. SGAir0287]QCR18172.1 amino-acid racemase [Agrococcus sp. SGAir0287]
MRDFPRQLRALGTSVSTPAPVVVRDVLIANVERMQAFADGHGKRLRPHVKTHKSVAIGRIQLEAGAIGLTAGTLAEAEIFADAGCDDILLAYPVWAVGTKADRIRALAGRIRLTVGVESVGAVDRLAEAMGDAAGSLGIVVEIDCGARRSGVQPHEAGALAVHARAAGLDVRGIYTYPGQGGTVGAPEGAAIEQADALRAAVASLAEHGVEATIVSAGSTPTFQFSTDPVITELRPGEYVFNDWDNVRIGDCTADDIALFVASTVVSDQGHPHVIVDAGTKALAREGNPERGYGQVPSHDGCLRSLNEYHGYLALPEGGERPAIGEPVAIVPHHVCPVVNSFEELVVIDADGTIVDRWQVDARAQLN